MPPYPDGSYFDALVRMFGNHCRLPPGRLPSNGSGSWRGWITCAIPAMTSVTALAMKGLLYGEVNNKVADIIGRPEDTIASGTRRGMRCWLGGILHWAWRWLYLTWNSVWNETGDDRPQTARSRDIPHWRQGALLRSRNEIPRHKIFTGPRSSFILWNAAVFFLASPHECSG